MKSPTEHAEACALIKLVKLHENRYPALRYLYHTPNGGQRNKIIAAKLKAEGVKTGVPDYLLPVMSSPYQLFQSGTNFTGVSPCWVFEPASPCQLFQSLPAFCENLPMGEENGGKSAKIVKFDENFTKPGKMHGLALELKRRDGTRRDVSPEQAEWLQHYASQGWAACVAFGHEQAWQIVRDYARACNM